MDEKHAEEQYFFDPPTLKCLSRFVRGFESPLLLCCPMLGQFMWEEDSYVVPTLDVDERFANLPGFIRWDILKPKALGEIFAGAEYGPDNNVICYHGQVEIRTRGMEPYVPDLVLVDPPFNIVRLDHLFAAVRILTNDVSTTGLMITTTPKRSAALVGMFAQYGLTPTGYKPTFVSVPSEKSIEFYGNVDKTYLAPLER